MVGNADCYVSYTLYTIQALHDTTAAILPTTCYVGESIVRCRVYMCLPFDSCVTCWTVLSPHMPSLTCTKVQNTSRTTVQAQVCVCNVSQAKSSWPHEPFLSNSPGVQACNIRTVSLQNMANSAMLCISCLLPCLHQQMPDHGMHAASAATPPGASAAA